jgi:hypothetical protein
MTNSENTIVARKTDIKKTISGKDMLPSRIKMSDNITRLVLGRLIGIANDITTWTDKEGQILEGLRGKFKYTDNDVTRNVLISSVLWLPAGMGTDIIDAASEKTTDGVEFGFDLGVVKAENPQGYSWFMTPFHNAAFDPLATVEARLHNPALVHAANTPSVEPKRAEPEHAEPEHAEPEHAEKKKSR